MTSQTTKGLDLPSIENRWGFKGENYLFTIGIDQYEHWSPLRCAVKDVRDFATILTDRYQFKDENVITLENEKATEQNIMAKFKDLIQQVTEEDNLVIYFSGHGHYDEITKTGYWVPVNAHVGEEYEYEFIDTGTIVNRLKRIDSLHTFLIVDACFSGTLITQIKSTPRSERYKSRRIFTSGRQEVVDDGPEGGNSPFARGLLTYLENNTDKYFSTSELILDVREYVEKESQQTPMEGRIINADDQGGDFVFYLKMSEAEIWASTNEQHTREGYKKFMDQFPQSEHFDEARESYDWLTAKEENSIKSLRKYLDNYLPDGKFVSEAMKRLGAIEEEQIWERAKRLNTLEAYYEYQVRFPEGKYLDDAKEEIEQKTKGSEDDREVRKQVERKVQTETSKTRDIKPPEEEKAWEDAKNENTYLAYLDFTRAYPESRFTEEARQKMKRLDDIALNQIRLAEHNRSLSLQEKIEECLNYFNTYPGADNNKIVKQIKDRLQIQKYTKKHDA